MSSNRSEFEKRMNTAFSQTYFEMGGMLKGFVIGIAKERGWPSIDEQYRQEIAGETIIFHRKDAGTQKKLDTGGEHKLLSQDCDLDGVGLAITESGYVLIGGDNFVWPLSEHTTETTVFELTDGEQEMVSSIVDQYDRYAKFTTD